MSLISLLVILLIVGVALWAFNTYVTTIDPKIKGLINAVVVIAVLLWILQAFGVFGPIVRVR